MLPELRTERLTLRPVAAGDVDDLWALWSSPEVRRYLFDDAPVPRDRVSEIVSECAALAAGGLGLWVVAPAGRRAPVGCAGLLPVGTAAEFEPRLRGEVEPLVALRADRWGRGYATEALRAVVAYAFDSLGLARLVASVDAPNAASHRLVSRLGFQPLRETPGPRHRLVHYLLAR